MIFHADQHNDNDIKIESTCMVDLRKSTLDQQGIILRVI